MPPRRQIQNSRPLMKRLSAPALMATDLPEREVIVDPILARKSLVLLYGPRGLGKTFVALGIAWAAPRVAVSSNGAGASRGACSMSTARWRRST